MSSFDNKFDAKNGHEHGHNNLVAQIIEGTIETICGTEVNAIVQSLLDQGDLRPETEDQSVCITCGCRCGRPTLICPRCGNDGSETHDSLDPSEIDDDEQPGFKPADTDAPPAAIPQLEERITHFLSNAGVLDAHEVAFVLAPLWSAEASPSIEALARLVCDSISIAEADARLFAEDLLFYLKPEKVKAPPAHGNLRVFYDEKWKKWCCEPINPLSGLMATGVPGATIQKGGVTIRSERAISWLGKEMPETLKKVGDALIRHRLAFFEATSRVEANKVLLSQALEQKSVAKELNIPQTKLNRFCTRGVVVATDRHGLIPLRAFFRIEATTDVGETRTRSAVIEAIAEEFRRDPTLNGLSWEKIKPKLSEWNLAMAERTWRNYKKQISEILSTEG